MRLIHLTDLHLFADSAMRLRGVNTADSLAAVIEHVCDSAYRADAAIVSGDIVQEELQVDAAYAHARERLLQLDIPIYFCPGNHDRADALNAALSEPPFAGCGSYQLGGWQLISLDSRAAGDHSGELGPSELKRLEQSLTDSGQRHVLLALHHPPVSLGSDWLDHYDLRDRDELFQIATTRVRCMLFGHAHQAYDRMHDGVRLIGSPSTCDQFVPQSSEFAVDDLPPAYRRLELKPNGTINTEIVWLDSFVK